MRVLGLVMIAVSVLFSCQKVDWTDLDEDKHQVQQRLDQGETPLEIYQSGVPMEHIFGKKYQNGVIFYMNTQTGEGLVCSESDIFNNGFQSYYNVWGDENFALPAGVSLQDGVGAGEHNTSVLAPLSGVNESVLNEVGTYSGETNWYLPSQQELMMIHNNLHRLRLADFSLELYWTSSVENDMVICIDFSDNSIANPVVVEPTAVVRARAVKRF